MCFWELFPGTRIEVVLDPVLGYMLEKYMVGWTCVMTGMVYGAVLLGLGYGDVFRSEADTDGLRHPSKIWKDGLCICKFFISLAVGNLVSSWQESTFVDKLEPRRNEAVDNVEDQFHFREHRLPTNHLPIYLSDISNHESTTGRFK